MSGALVNKSIYKYIREVVAVNFVFGVLFVAKNRNSSSKRYRAIFAQPTIQQKLRDIFPQANIIAHIIYTTQNMTCT